MFGTMFTARNWYDVWYDVCRLSMRCSGTMFDCTIFGQITNFGAPKSYFFEISHRSGNTFGTCGPWHFLRILLGLLIGFLQPQFWQRFWMPSNLATVFFRFFSSGKILSENHQHKQRICYCHILPPHFTREYARLSMWWLKIWPVTTDIIPSYQLLPVITNMIHC